MWNHALTVTRRLRELRWDWLTLLGLIAIGTVIGVFIGIAIGFKYH